MLLSLRRQADVGGRRWRTLPVKQPCVLSLLRSPPSRRRLFTIWGWLRLAPALTQQAEVPLAATLCGTFPAQTFIFVLRAAHPVTATLGAAATALPAGTRLRSTAGRLRVPLPLRAARPGPAAQVRQLRTLRQLSLVARRRLHRPRSRLPPSSATRTRRYLGMSCPQVLKTPCSTSLLAQLLVIAPACIWMISPWICGVLAEPRRLRQRWVQ